MDDQSKTVVRIVLDHSAIPGCPAETWPVHLSVVPVRGYGDQGDRVARILSDAPACGQHCIGVRAGPAVAGDGPGLRQQGGHPLDPSMPAASAVATVLETFLTDIEANLSGVIEDIDIEFLHDFRVAVRRSRSTREAARRRPAARPGRGWVTPEFKWLGDLTTPSRDLDVHLLELRRDGRRAAWRPSRPTWSRCARICDRRRERSADGSPRACSRAVRRLLDDWRAGRSTAGRTASADGGSSRADRRLAAERRRACLPPDGPSTGAAIDDDSPAEDCTTCASGARSCATCSSSSRRCTTRRRTRPIVRTLKALQDVLGRFQDREVQARRSARVADADDGRATAAAATLMAMGELVGAARRATRPRPRRVRRRASRAFARPQRTGARSRPDASGRRREGPRDLQHQGRRRQDVGRGQPRLPRRPRRRRARCSGTSTRRARAPTCSASSRRSRAAGASSSAARRDVDDADQGHRLRAASTCCRPTSPTATWTSRSTRPKTPDAPARPRARAARRRLRLRLPRLPAEHLAGLRERLRGRRRAARPADPGDAVARARSTSSPSSSSARRTATPRSSAFFSMVDRPQAPAPRVIERPPGPRVAVTAIPALRWSSRWPSARPAAGVRPPEPGRPQLRAAVGGAADPRLPCPPDSLGRSVEARPRSELLTCVAMRERLVGHRHTKRGTQRPPAVARLPLEQPAGRDGGTHRVGAFVCGLGSRAVLPSRFETGSRADR